LTYDIIPVLDNASQVYGGLLAPRTKFIS